MISSRHSSASSFLGQTTVFPWHKWNQHQREKPIVKKREEANKKLVDKQSESPKKLLAGKKKNAHWHFFPLKPYTTSFRFCRFLLWCHDVIMMIEIYKGKVQKKRGEKLTNVSFAFTHTYTPVKTNIFPFFPQAYMENFEKCAMYITKIRALYGRFSTTARKYRRAPIYSGDMATLGGGCGC